MEDAKSAQAELGNWSLILGETATSLRVESRTLVKKARDLRAKAQRLRQLARNSKEKPWSPPQGKS
ncbi:MAG TPA: hypothetical protein VKT29_03470 [Terriglobales bacterium]|nr:hypothetical protein [Terriglobales bacterium]